MRDTFTTPVELKFMDESQPGTFEGYAACFNNIDSHGDVIAPGAFKDTLEKHQANGTMPALHFEHDWAWGGDPMPAGVWTSFTEDAKGLKGVGKISALDTDYGRRVRSLMQDGAVRGLSIAFSVPEGGAEIGKKAGEPKRMLKAINLRAVDLVKWPSNDLAMVDSVKGILSIVDKESASRAVASAINLHVQTMSANDSPTSEERATILTHLQDAHEHLTGTRMPKAMKSAPPQTIREFEKTLREIGFSNSQARALAVDGFKSLANPRDEGNDTATNTATAFMAALLKS